MRMPTVRSEKELTTESLDRFTSLNSAEESFVIPPPVMPDKEPPTMTEKVLDRVGSIRPRIEHKADELRHRGSEIAHRGEDYLRSNPIQWTAAATAVGLGLGLLTRYLRRRLDQPQVIVIEKEVDQNQPWC
jgi:ElaB/YqjD/DUF883 family membrane-anchored ribosome-binding protein